MSSGSSGASGTNGSTISATAGNGSTSGGSTGGMWDAGYCALTEFSTRSGSPGGAACGSNSDCNCDQWCVSDPTLPGPATRLCETPCNSDADCPNAASICTSAATPLANVGKTCTMNLCNTCITELCPPGAVAPGAECDIGAMGSGGGTCMPTSPLGTRGICMPNGTATACTLGATNDDPFLSSVVSPQPKSSTLFCGAGQGCYNPGGLVGEPGTCLPLCQIAPDGGPNPCAAPTFCAMQDPYVPIWGFCLPCQPSSSDGGQAGICLSNSDCCEGNCRRGSVNLGGLCFPSGG